MKCECGSKFAGPGEFRNCEAFVTSTGHSGIICPDCGTSYVGGQKMGLTVKEETDGKEESE